MRKLGFRVIKSAVRLKFLTETAFRILLSGIKWHCLNLRKSLNRLLALVIEIMYMKVFGKLSEPRSYSYIWCIPFICTFRFFMKIFNISIFQKNQSSLAGPAALSFIYCKINNLKKKSTSVVSNSSPLIQSLTTLTF